jgi:Tfp pilus assembly ATPase PilU
MKITARVYMKHMMHKARDLFIAYEIDLIKRAIVLNVNWIDTALIEDFITRGALHAINRQLEEIGKLPLATNIDGYTIELIVEGKVHLDVRLVESDYEPKEPTLVMRVKE